MMEGKITVTIGGEDYPCRPTMGAMLRFRRETGRDITQLKTDEFYDLSVYLYCCVVSACAADKIPFDMSLMDFADQVKPEDMVLWSEKLAQQPQPGEKKSGDSSLRLNA